MKFSSLIISACILCVVVSSLGCTDSALKTEMVSGKVTLDGQALADTDVFFKPKDENGITAWGKTDRQGTYYLTAMQGGRPGKGTVPGEYIVTVSKTNIVLTNPEAADPNSYVYRTDNILPVFYTDPAKTPFSATVVKGKNTIDLELKNKR